MRSRFFSSLGAMLLGAMSLSMPWLPPMAEDVTNGRRVGATRAAHAHSRHHQWKKARASGRHDFRRTLRA